MPKAAVAEASTAPPATDSTPIPDTAEAARQLYLNSRRNLVKLRERRQQLALAIVAITSQPRRPAAPTAGVAALVVGLPPPAPDPGPDPDAELGRLRTEANDVDMALLLQQDRTRTLAADASYQTCQAAEPEHRRLIARIRLAVVELIAAAEAERKFRRDIQAMGVDVVYPVREDLGVEPNISCGDGTGWAQRWLDRAAGYAE